MNPVTTARRRRGLTGPVILIALGTLFLLDQLVPGWSFGKTWPLLLIILGVLKLIEVTEPPRGPSL